MVPRRSLHIATHAVHFDRVLFCCKEAVYKAWFPLTGRILGFGDALRRWIVHDGLTLAAVTVPIAGV